MQGFRRATATATAAAVTLLGMSVAGAKPATATVDGIYRCRGSSCSGTPVAAGSILVGGIEIEVTARTGLAGLDRIRLEALPPDKAGDAETDASWVCLEDWFGERAISFTRRYRWQTGIWPDPPNNSQCPEVATHFHKGKPSLNGAYQIRLRALDVGDNEWAVGEPISIKLANAPRSPSWMEPPLARGAAVVVRWIPNGETDVSEYHFVRTSPDGHAKEFAVDARRPSAQGCSRVTSLYYSCTDRSFAGEQSGTYLYAILALRPAPGGAVACSLSRVPCAESLASASQSVNVVVPAFSASPSAGSTSPEPAKTDGLPAPVVVPTGDAANVATAPVRSRASPKPPGLLVWLAALMLALSAAALIFAKRKVAGRAMQKDRS